MCCITVFLMGTSMEVHAKKKKSESQDKSKGSGDKKKKLNKIQAVNGDTVTIALPATETTKTLTVNTMAKIMVNGRNAKLTEVQSGMTVLNFTTSNGDNLVHLEVMTPVAK